MPLETDYFIEFVEFLKAEDILDAEQIDEALKYLGGLDGVVAERYFIFGYENIAWYLNKKLSFDELSSFVSEYVEVLAQDAGARYFFAQSLLEKSELSKGECESLISCMPEKYQPFLLKRFLKSR